MRKKLFTNVRPVETVLGVADQVDATIGSVGKTIESTVGPMRKNILKRYPTLFLLAVTFGVTATALGTEQMLARSAFLMQRPYLLLLIGVSILILTGTAYRKYH